MSASIELGFYVLGIPCAMHHCLAFYNNTLMAEYNPGSSRITPLISVAWRSRGGTLVLMVVYQALCCWEHKGPCTHSALVNPITHKIVFLREKMYNTFSAQMAGTGSG